MLQLDSKFKRFYYFNVKIKILYAKNYIPNIIKL